MNISKLYQRAHALRMADWTESGIDEPGPEFYVGQALGKHIGIKRQASEAADALRNLAKQEALVLHLHWHDDVSVIWASLLRTYGDKPLLLRAIADGMEA